MDDKFLDRLARAEDGLVSAMLAGERELASYDLAWTSLLEEITRSSTDGNLKRTTLNVAHDVVSRVSTLVDCCLTLSSVPPPTSPSLDPHSIPTSPVRGPSSFIPEAYSWLLENLSNPYPSLAVKTSIAQRYNYPVSAVNSWFANARRRMGWTALCRDHFHNSRVDAVDAAYRALVKEDPKRQLPPEVTHTFIAMKVTAEELYSATFAKSALAGDLDAVVKDMADQDKMAANRKTSETNKLGNWGERERETFRRPSRMLDMESRRRLMAQPSYPSSSRSRSSSPVPSLEESLTDESEDEEDILPPILAGRKRRLSYSESTQVSGTRSKRPCSTRSSSLSPIFLSSPSVDIEDFSVNNCPKIPPSALIPQNFTTLTPSRIRRLSHSDTNGISERHGDLVKKPPSTTVSDPLPHTSMESENFINEWFSTNFDALFALPPPVDAFETDLSADWEVALFNNYNVPKDMQKCPTAKSLSSSIQNSALTDLSVLLQSIESSEFSPPTEKISRDCISSDQYVDWPKLFGTDETIEADVDSLVPRNPANPESLPETGLCILPPQLMPSIVSHSTFSIEAKTAKLQQLQAMQEVVRRMEKELQAEGVAL